MDVKIDGVKYVPMPDAPTGKTLIDALDVRFCSDAGDDMTVRDYLFTLLNKVWHEEECFDGKRPFGNGGWQCEILYPLAKAGFLDLGPLDDDVGGDGNPYNYTDDQRRMAHAFVSDLIAAAFYGVTGE